ncbi:MAG TPA: hypothetical protein VKV25_07445, partial [Acidimicrobiales bacterium]|nr:hypothetical protein [Acidimicrobiales bacterium]
MTRARRGAHLAQSPEAGHRPRLARRFLVACNIVVAVLLVGSGLVYGYVRYRLDSVKTGSGADLSHADGSR